MSVYAEAQLEVGQGTLQEVCQELAKRYPGRGRWSKAPEAVTGSEAKVLCLFRWDESGSKVVYDLTPQSGSPYQRGSSAMVPEMSRILDDWLMTNCHAHEAKKAAITEGFSVIEEWQEATATPILVCERGDSVASVATSGDFEV